MCANGSRCFRERREFAASILGFVVSQTRLPLLDTTRLTDEADQQHRHAAAHANVGAG